MNIDRHNPFVQWMEWQKLQGDAGTYISDFLEGRTKTPPFDFNRPGQDILIYLASQPPGPSLDHSDIPSRFTFLAGLVLARSYQDQHDFSGAARALCREENILSSHRCRLHQEVPDFSIKDPVREYLLKQAIGYLCLAADQESTRSPPFEYRCANVALYSAKLANIIHHNGRDRVSLRRAYTHIEQYAKLGRYPFFGQYPHIQHSLLDLLASLEYPKAKDL